MRLILSLVFSILVIAKVNAQNGAVITAFDSISISYNKACSDKLDFLVYANQDFIFKYGNKNDFNLLGYRSGKFSNKEWVSLQKQLYNIKSSQLISSEEFYKEKGTDGCSEYFIVNIYTDGEIEHFGSRNIVVQDITKELYDNAYKLKHIPSNRKGERDNVKRIYFDFHKEDRFNRLDTCLLVDKKFNEDNEMYYYLARKDTLTFFVFSNHNIPVNTKIGYTGEYIRDEDLEYIHQLFGIGYTKIINQFEIDNTEVYFKDYVSFYLDHNEINKYSIYHHSRKEIRKWKKSEAGKSLLQICKKNNIKPAHNKGY